MNSEIKLTPHDFLQTTPYNQKKALRIIRSAFDSFTVYGQVLANQAGAGMSSIVFNPLSHL